MEDQIEVIIKKNGEEVAHDFGDFCIVQVVQNNAFDSHVHGSTAYGQQQIFDALGSLVAAICEQAADGSFDGR